MTRFRKPIIGAASFIAISVGLVVAAQAQTRGGTLTYSAFGTPNTLDCAGLASIGQTASLVPGYSTLLRFDPKDPSKVVGDLAESWVLSPDRMTYTFKIKSGVLFHDGTTLSSADVKASFDRLRNPPPGVTSLRSSLYTDIASIETPDATTVVFKFAKVSPLTVVAISHPLACIYSAKKLAENPKYPDNQIMGTGPFKMTEYVPGSHVSFVRNDSYFVKDLPYLDGLKSVFLSVPGTITALSGGQIDMMPNLLAPAGRDQIQAVRGNKTVFQEGPYNSVNLVSINLTKPPLDDVRVRRALQLALDRRSGDVLLQKVSNNKGFGILLPDGTDFDMTREEMYALPGYGPDMAANRAEAKKLLAEAGQSNLKLTLLNRTIGEPYTTLGVYVVDQLRQIGVTVEQRLVETAPYFGNLSALSFDIAIDSNPFLTADPTEVFVKFLPNSNQNFSGYKDQVLQDLYDRQAISNDPAERKKLSIEFQKRMVDQVYILSMFRNINIVAMASDVHGYTLMPTPMMNADLRSVWMDKR